MIFEKYPGSSAITLDGASLFMDTSGLTDIMHIHIAKTLTAMVLFAEQRVRT